MFLLVLLFHWNSVKKKIITDCHQGEKLNLGNIGLHCIKTGNNRNPENSSVKSAHSGQRETAGFQAGFSMGLGKFPEKLWSNGHWWQGWDEGESPHEWPLQVLSHWTWPYISSTLGQFVTLPEPWGSPAWRTKIEADRVMLGKQRGWP
jgi:hypothetical protein